MGVNLADPELSKSNEMGSAFLFGFPNSYLSYVESLLGGAMAFLRPVVFCFLLDSPSLSFFLCSNFFWILVAGAKNLLISQHKIRLRF